MHVISAVGRRSAGTVAPGLDRLGITCDGVHELLFRHPRESPELKLAKCLELGIGVFYDNRADVCDLLNDSGIMALRVPRRQAGNIDELPGPGQERIATWCCHPPGGLPHADAHLAQYLHLVTDEPGFRETGNRTPRRRIPASAAA